MRRKQIHLLSFVLTGFASASPLSAQLMPSVPLSTPAPALEAPKATSEQMAYREAMALRNKGDFDGALAKVSESLAKFPESNQLMILRGDLYAKKKQWTEAEQDFDAVMKVDPQNTLARFNLAELKLMQKQYEAARPGFEILSKDKDLGDLASYKVFLCDLYGGNRKGADEELKAFDKAQSGPSYYYANAAWNLYFGRPDDARSWLDSATRIYTPAKNYNYQSTLKELGYLPLPKP